MKNEMNSLGNVLEGGYCIGCGACAVAMQGALTLRRNEHGLYRAALSSADAAHEAFALKACPFAAGQPSEDDLGRALYGSPGAGSQPMRHDPRLGHHLSLLTGRLTDDTRLPAHSSGGLTTWVLEQLLARGEVDGVIHVSPVQAAGEGLFEYRVSESLGELQGRTKSRYYSVSFDRAVLGIRGNGRRYAFVGVPCFVKAMRLLCAQDEGLRGQVAYTVALVCGHLKGPAFAELLAWQAGVPPERLARFDFRVKDPARSAHHYSVLASDGSTEHQRVSRTLYGSNWGHAFFQLKACDFCDDVMGELGDVSFGDAWLPQYQSDWRGTNIVICRHPTIERILREGAAAGAITIEDQSADTIAASQAGNYRHRWDGLSVRLADAQRRGEWTPPKRIAPGSIPVPYLRRVHIRLRQAMAAQSHGAFLEARRRGDLQHFFRTMQPMTERMARLDRLTYWLSGDFILGKVLNPAWYVRKLLKKPKPAPH